MSGKMTVKDLRNTEGFTMIEVLTVVTVMVVVLAVGSSYLSGKFALRRSVDELTNNISSMLNLGKLRSVRDGVEYRVVFADCTNVNESDPDCFVCNSPANYVEYQTGDEELTMILERGDSNRGSTAWCIQSTHTKRFQSDLEIVASANLPEAGNPLNYTFVPTGMRRDFLTDANDEIITIRPVGGSKIDKCGQIEVSPTGGIAAIEGRWDGSECNAILDDPIVTPTPGP